MRSRVYQMAARRYEISLPVLKNIFSKNPYNTKKDTLLII